VLSALGIDGLDPIVLSSEEQIEKPSKEIFQRCLERINASNPNEIHTEECLHVGDDLER
jgi:FMN phosphatase YigB (HAD superfamily)